jgi:hypothetical protein
MTAMNNLQKELNSTFWLLIACFIIHFC